MWRDADHCQRHPYCPHLTEFQVVEISSSRISQQVELEFGVEWHALVGRKSSSPPTSCSEYEFLVSPCTT